MECYYTDKMPADIARGRKAFTKERVAKAWKRETVFRHSYVIVISKPQKHRTQF